MPGISRYTNQEETFLGAKVYDVNGEQIHSPKEHRITVNLEDAVLEEQKLFSILEVSWIRLNSYLELAQQPE